jgi:hypothetical protein
MLVDISMPGYVEKILACFEHKLPHRPQHSPHATPPRKFGNNAQEPVKHNHLPILPPDRIKRVQQIIGTIHYYARAVDITTLVALSSITSEQTKATTATKTQVTQLLDYLYTHKDATIQYVASDMVLNVHSDASYLSEPKARRHLGVFLRRLTHDRTTNTVKRSNTHSRQRMLIRRCSRSRG